MPLRIYNTLARAEVDFAPREAGHVKVYVCGPTVYDLSHVGHARAYVSFDTVVRYLRRHFKVTYVRNFTDIDDKIIKRANERSEPPAQLAERFIGEFNADMATLGCLLPDVAPRVTEHVPEVVALTEALIAKGMAYAANGDVYYAVERFAEYGRLGRRSLEDMEAGARVEVSEHKRHPMDFVLWKGAKPGEPSWPSPWGPGRPGWHIECSAMAKKYLGDTFDIHGGGRDLIFPHHENEIAQSEGATGATFAHVWMHNGLVNIDNEKMSKSLGNFFTIRQVLDTFDQQTLRFYLLCTHYRSPINFYDAGLREAEGRVRYFYGTLQRVAAAVGDCAKGAAEAPHRDAAVAGMLARFDAAMASDFNTAQAIGDLSEMFRLANEILAKPADADADARTLRAIYQSLQQIGQVLGLFLEPPAEVLQRIQKRREEQRGVDPAVVEKLIADRQAARQNKDFQRADVVRAELQKLGIEIKDTPNGTTWKVI